MAANPLLGAVRVHALDDAFNNGDGQVFSSSGSDSQSFDPTKKTYGDFGKKDDGAENLFGQNDNGTEKIFNRSNDGGAKRFFVERSTFQDLASERKRPPDIESLFWSYDSTDPRDNELIITFDKESLPGYGNNTNREIGIESLVQDALTDPDRVDSVEELNSKKRKYGEAFSDDNEGTDDVDSPSADSDDSDSNDEQGQKRLRKGFRNIRNVRNRESKRRKIDEAKHIKIHAIEENEPVTPYGLRPNTNHLSTTSVRSAANSSSQIAAPQDPKNASQKSYDSHAKKARIANQHARPLNIERETAKDLKRSEKGLWSADSTDPRDNELTRAFDEDLPANDSQEGKKGGGGLFGLIEDMLGYVTTTLLGGDILKAISAPSDVMPSTNDGKSPEGVENNANDIVSKKHESFSAQTDTNEPRFLQSESDVSESGSEKASVHLAANDIFLEKTDNLTEGDATDDPTTSIGETIDIIGKAEVISVLTELFDMPSSNDKEGENEKLEPITPENQESDKAVPFENKGEFVTLENEKVQESQKVSQKEADQIDATAGTESAQNVKDWAPWAEEKPDVSFGGLGDIDDELDEIEDEIEEIEGGSENAKYLAAMVDAKGYEVENLIEKKKADDLAQESQEAQRKQILFGSFKNIFEKGLEENGIHSNEKVEDVADKMYQNAKNFNWDLNEAVEFMNNELSADTNEARQKRAAFVRGVLEAIGGTSAFDNSKEQFAKIATNQAIEAA